MNPSKIAPTRARRRSFRAPRYLERSLTIAALLTLIGTALIVTGIAVGDAPGTVVTSLGTIAISVAALSVLYDAFLKDVLLGEIYSAIGIQENFRAVDLLQVGQKDRIDLDDMLAGAAEITAVPVDPETWLHTDWHHLVNQAVGRPTAVTVLLPDHDSPHIDVLAARLGLARDQLATQIAELPDKLGRSWDGKGNAIQHSTLSVYLYGTVPAVGLLVTESTVLVEIPPALQHTPTDRQTLALVFGRGGWLPLVTDFVDDQLFEEGRLAESRIPEFSSSVVRPLPPAVSPDATLPRQTGVATSPGGEKRTS
jgi:hypothetical protein